MRCGKIEHRWCPGNADVHCAFFFCLQIAKLRGYCEGGYGVGKNITVIVEGPYGALSSLLFCDRIGTAG